MYGIVMAGGLSSRMGRNKLRLSIHGDGKDMLERTVELLGGFTDDVFVSCRAPEDAAPFKAIPDEVDRQGPFGGVYSALRRLQKPILVLSCDLPFMDGPTLRRLLDAREARLPGTIMTTYQQEETGFIEALVAVYEPACLPWFDAAWEQGIRKFSVVIPEELRTHVPYSRSEALPFFNINYPADFEIARRLAELAQIARPRRELDEHTVLFEDAPELRVVRRRKHVEHRVAAAVRQRYVGQIADEIRRAPVALRRQQNGLLREIKPDSDHVPLRADAPQIVSLAASRVRHDRALGAHIFFQRFADGSDNRRKNTRLKRPRAALEQLLFVEGRLGVRREIDVPLLGDVVAMALAAEQAFALLMKTARTDRAAKKRDGFILHGIPFLGLRPTCIVAFGSLQFPIPPC